MEGDFMSGFLAGQGDSKNNNDGFFGNEGLWAVIILAIIFGWGRNNFGGNNGNGDSVSVLPYLMNGGFNASSADTRSAIADSFALDNITSGIRGIQQGICDSTYALNNAITSGFNNTNIAMLQGFNGVQSQLCNMAAQNQACCCETQRIIERGFADTGYRMATDTCAIQNSIANSTRDIIDSQNSGTRAILDFLTQDKISTLQAENQTLKFAASQQAQNAYIAANQEAQTAELIRRLGPTPVPAYQVPAPYPYCVGNAGYGNGCGCTA